MAEQMTPEEARAGASPEFRAWADRMGLEIVGFRTRLTISAEAMEKVRASPQGFKALVQERFDEVFAAWIRRFR